MDEMQIANLFFYVVFILSSLLLVTKLRKMPVFPLIWTPPDIEYKKTFSLVVLNISQKTAYNRCLEWLETFQSRIIEQQEPTNILAEHTIDVHTTTFLHQNIQTLKDIPKKIEFRFNQYAGMDTIVWLNILIDTKRRDVKRFDFLDLDWYKQELETIFKEYETK